MRRSCGFDTNLFVTTYFEKHGNNIFSMYAFFSSLEYTGVQVSLSFTRNVVLSTPDS